ncbi:MAG TPA: hypothetical protein VFT31_12955 [Kribbella sp.]|nr:hypothetical protein [Kribbella sp.]
MTDYPGEQFPPSVDPDVEPDNEPSAEPREEPAHQPDYDTEPEGSHPLVEETTNRLDGLRERPVSEHAEVYAGVHERLQTALVEADADYGERG